MEGLEGVRDGSLDSWGLRIFLGRLEDDELDELG